MLLLLLLLLLFVVVVIVIVVSHFCLCSASRAPPRWTRPHRSQADARAAAGKFDDDAVENIDHAAPVSLAVCFFFLIFFFFLSFFSKSVISRG